MLRGIYAFYLFFFLLLVFTLGLILIPFGYFATLIIKIRLIYNRKLPSEEKEVLMSSSPANPNRDELTHQTLSLIFFLFFGWAILFVQNIKDSLEFAKQCWRETPERTQMLSSNLPHSSPLVAHNTLLSVRDLAHTILQ